MNQQAKTRTSGRRRANGEIPRPAPLPVRNDHVRLGLIHVPGVWPKAARAKRATRRLGDYNGPMGDYNGPLGDYNGPLGEYNGPMGDYNGPLGDYNGGLGGQIFVGMGYHSDLADYRDYGWGLLDEFIKSMPKAKSSRVKNVAQRARKVKSAQFNLGDDPAHPLPPIENQGRTNSCTAQAAAGMLEYLYRWGTGDYNDFSRMFIYFNSRKLLGWSGDIGSYIRTTFQAMCLFGAPPESQWPFDLSLLDAEPLPYHYAYASNFKTLKYARLDSYRDSAGQVGLYDRVKRVIRSGFPVEFGFPVYSCIQKLNHFVIPVPSETDGLLGGHAVLAVGYNDNVRYNIPPKPGDAKRTPTKKRGALIIRNSWGPDWGDHGYAFLPRWYIDEGYASDFWTAYDEEWLKLSDFGR